MADTEADYHLDQDGDIRPNALCAGVAQRYRQAVEEHQRLTRRFAALVLAQVFHSHPWLAEFRLSITVSYEYDDAGGYYRSMSLSVDEARRLPSAPLPGDPFSEGQWDAELALSLIDSMLEDSSFDLYEGLSPQPADNEELTLHLLRDCVAPALAQERVNGAAALQALLPQLDTALQPAPAA